MNQTTEPRTGNKHEKHLSHEKKKARIIRISAVVVFAAVVLIIGIGLVDELVFKSSRTIAKVGDQNITLGEFQTNVRFSRRQLINQYFQTQQYIMMFGEESPYSEQFKTNLTEILENLNPDNKTTLAEEVVDRLIKDAIIDQEAKKRGITVTDEEVNKKLEEIFEYYPNGTPTPEATLNIAPTSTLSSLQLGLVTLTPVPTEAPTETPEPTLTPTVGPTPTASPVPSITPTATPFTKELYDKRLTDFLADMAKDKLSEKDVRTTVYKDLLYQKVMQAITSEVKPEREEVWARHILVADEATAKTVIDRLGKGEDWSKLAAELSTDTSNKDNGGDLGWFPRGQMVPEFEEVAFAYKVGEISPPIKTDFGYHIIQILGHEVRPINAYDLQTEKESVFNTWIEGEMSSDKVQKFNNWSKEIPTDPQIPTISPDIVETPAQ